MPAADREEVKKKGFTLGVGETAWIKPYMRIFTQTFRMKAVDWLNVSRGAGLHIFDGHIGVGLDQQQSTDHQEAFEEILTLFHMCCNTTCNVDGAAPKPAEADRMREFKKFIITLLAVFERETPDIFMHAYPHVAIHLPDLIYRWGSARTIWCFFLERFVGWSKEFVTGRNNTAKAFINAYTRLTFLRRMHPAIREIYVSSAHTASFDGAMGQFLKPYENYEDCSGTQGHGGLHVALSNSRKRDVPIISTLGQSIVDFVNDNSARADVVLEDRPTAIKQMHNGITINGKKWQVGTPGFYADAGSKSLYGTVKQIYVWTDRFATTVIFTLHRYVVRGDTTTSYVASKPDLPQTTIFWNELTYRCKAYPTSKVNVVTGVRRHYQAVVRVSSTKPYMDGMEFDTYHD